MNEKGRPKENLSPAQVGERLLTLAAIRAGVQRAVETARHVSVPPLPGGRSGPIFATTKAAGIKWGPLVASPHIDGIQEPCDFWTDPCGTFHAIQWDGPTGA